jgi:uncharacterized protein YprB with RNaseH-like and TPR domain
VGGRRVEHDQSAAVDAVVRSEVIMFNDALRLRLESLNRGPLHGLQLKTTLAEPVAAEKHTVAKRRFSSAGLVRSGEVVVTSVGEHWRVRVPMDALWQGGANLVAARQEHLRTLLTAARQSIEPTILLDAEFSGLVAALPDRAVMLDLETCGLAGSALFLVGLLRQVDGIATVELLLARTFAEEAAVLESLWQTMACQDVVVTFNGKSFDWPMVLERTVRHRLKSSKPGGIQHLDVLHHARRRWRRQLPDCRLQTLERHVCRRHRAADIPGSAIPAIYADYVRTGFERDMDVVLYHNAIDLVTLFDLALRLAA